MPNFPRGAKPSPRHRLLAIAPHTPLLAAPAQFAAVPSKLSMWQNHVYGCCVTTEEAFAKAAYSVALGLPETFVPDSEVYRFANKHGYLNGATLVDVLDTMKATDGLAVGGVLLHDGGYAGVDYSDESILQSAIATGPVKIAIDADALPAGAGNVQGWSATSGQHYGNTDHCVALAGYGRADYLYDQLKAALPSGLSAGMFGYLLFTWATIGFVTRDWILGTCVESFVRNPTTPGQAPATTVIVPGLVGGTWDSSRRALANVGLVIAPASVGDPSAKVATQTPPQMVAVPVGSTVTVTLAVTPPAPNRVRIVVDLPNALPGTIGTATVG